MIQTLRSTKWKSWLIYAMVILTRQEKMAWSLRYALCCTYGVDRTLLLRVLRMFFSPFRTSKMDILQFFAILWRLVWWRWIIPMTLSLGALERIQQRRRYMGTSRGIEVCFKTMYIKIGFCWYLDLINIVWNFSNCQDAIREFVTSGFKSKILPLPVRTCFWIEFLIFKSCMIVPSTSVCTENQKSCKWL